MKIRFLTGFIKFLKGISCRFKPKFIIDYGNYGGAMYTARYIYDHLTGNLYKKIDNGDFVFETDLSDKEYVDFMVNTIKTCQPIDEIDVCFKLHDIDSN